MHFPTNTWHGRGTPNGPVKDEDNVRHAYRNASLQVEQNGGTVRWVVDEDFIFTTVNMIGPEYDSIIVKSEDEAVRVWWENYCLPTWDYVSDEWGAEYKAHFEPRYTY